MLALSMPREAFFSSLSKLAIPLGLERRRVANIYQPVVTSGQSADYAWDESKSLMLQSIGSVISEFPVSQTIHPDSLSKAWSVFVTHIHDTVSLDRRNLSPPALLCLGKVVKALSGAAASLQEKV
jgi:hypothetical protein